LKRENSSPLSQVEMKDDAATAVDAHQGSEQHDAEAGR
jgi:hypothetical protein